jgi:hypothetical protein
VGGLRPDDDEVDMDDERDRDGDNDEKRLTKFEIILSFFAFFSF